MWIREDQLKLHCKLSNRFKRLALLLALPTIEDRILEKKGSIPFVSKVINHRSECLAFAPFLIRHFSLVCLLAVLIFSPKVSFATTVQGTTAYSSSAEAQTQINTLITVAIAAHPGATQNGNAVQWVEDGRSVTRAWTIRGGLSTISKFTLRYYGGGGDVYNAPRFDFTLIGYDGFAALRNQALGIVPSILRNRPDDPNVVGNNSELVNNPHAEPEDVFIAYDAYRGGVRWSTRMVINYGATTAVITPYYIDYQDTGSQLCPVPELREVKDIPPNGPDVLPLTLVLENTKGSDLALLPAAAEGLACLKRKTAGVFVSSGTRTVAYQAHLKDVWDTLIELNKPSNLKIEACKPLRDKVLAEKGGCSDNSGHCIKFHPATDSKHTIGKAFDVHMVTIDSLLLKLRPVPPLPPKLPLNSEQQKQADVKLIADLLAKPAACSLVWGGSYGDFVHFAVP